MDNVVNFIFFNIYEGVFWIALAFVCGFVVVRGVPHRYSFLGMQTSVTLLVFGLTDVVGNLVNSPWVFESQWLFLIKSICAVGLVLSLFWFIQLRSSECC